jgi:Tfp pilus assembly protein PilV
MRMGPLRRHRRPARCRTPAAGGDESGFTVIECVVALSLFMIVLVPSAQFLVGGIRMSGDAKNRLTAGLLATQALGELRSQALSDVTFYSDVVGVAQAPRTVTVPAQGGVAFTVQKVVDLQPSSSAGSSDCPAATTAVPSQVIELAVTVRWPNMGANSPVTSTTDFAPPPGTFPSAAGAFSLQVDTATGAPNAGVTVALSGPSTASVVTGTSGCAYFPNLASGTYTATASAAGEVTPTGQSSTGYSAAVTAGAVTGTNPVVLDSPATIVVGSLRAPGGAVTPAGLVYSLHNSGYTPTPSLAFSAAQNGVAPPAAQVFPFSGTPFSVYAGTCTDDDPQGQTTAGQSFYSSMNSPPDPPPAGALQGLNPAGGATVTAAVPLYAMPVALTGNPASVRQDTLTIVETSPAAVNWPAAANWSCPAAIPAPATLTGLAPGAATVAMPLGHYTLTLTNSSTHATSSPVYVWVRPDGTYVLPPTTGLPGAAGTVALVAP